MKPAPEDGPNNSSPPPKYQDVYNMNRVSEKAGNSVTLNGFSSADYDKSVDELPVKKEKGDKKDGDTDSKTGEKKEEETPMVGTFEVVSILLLIIL